MATPSGHTGSCFGWSGSTLRKQALARGVKPSARKVPKRAAVFANSSLAAVGPRGTEGTPRCNYGRSCGVLAIRGKDVAEILIGEGLARRYVCGATRCPKR
jgi:hypothetical protein